MNKEAPPSAGSGFRCGQIAVIGRPNVGKSTLLNRLIGAKVTITSRKAQTTRLPVRGILTTDTAQFVFVDTPGYQTKHGGEMNKRLNASVRKTLDEVDAILWVWDANRLVEADLAALALAPTNRAIIAVPNKVDLLKDKAQFANQLGDLPKTHQFSSIVPVSATKSTQTKALLVEIEKVLPVGEPMFDADDMTD
ncbi:MAG: GTPase Era, partial [Casimicrobium sp.]